MSEAWLWVAFCYLLVFGFIAAYWSFLRRTARRLDARLVAIEPVRRPPEV